MNHRKSPSPPLHQFVTEKELDIFAFTANVITILDDRKITIFGTRMTSVVQGGSLKFSVNKEQEIN